MGATSFALRVAHGSGRPVRRVVGIPGGVTPLAPLALALDVDPRGPLTAERLVSLRRRLMGTGPPPVVVVDGAESLDTDSAAVLADGAGHGLTMVLGVSRAGRLPPPLATVVRWMATTELVLAPLGPAEVTRLAVLVLGGPIDPGLVRALQRHVGGAPAAIVDVLVAARGEGSICRDGSVWRLAADLPVPTRLALRCDAVVDALPEHQRGAVDLLAVAGSLPATALRSLCSDEVMDALLDAGVAVPSGGHQEHVGLADPLVRTVRRERLGPVRRRHLARTAHQALVDTGEDAGLLALALDSGLAVTPDHVREAARTALAGGDPGLAAAVCHQRHVVVDDPMAALLLAELLMALGRSVEAEAFLRELTVTSTDEQAVLESIRATNLAYRLDDVDAALALTERAAERLAGTRWHGELLAFTGVLTLMRGDPVGALSGVSRLLSSGDARTRCQAATAAAPALVVTGRHDEAGRLAQHAAVERDALGLQPTLAAAGLHRAVAAWALAEAGHLIDADQRAREVLAAALAAGDREAQLWASVLHGRCLLDQGRFVEAAAVFDAAAAAAVDVDLVTHLRWARAGALLALAQTGDRDAAAAAGQALDAVPPSRLQLMASDVRRAHAWAAVALGDLPEATEQLRRAAAEAQAVGAAGLELAARHDLVRLGVPESVDRLVALGTVVQGPLARARVEHGLALAERDGERLAGVSEALERLGALVLAAEAANHAAWLWQRGGHPSRAVRLRRRCAALRARRPEAATPGLDLQPGMVDLTRREREVTALAAAGMSSRQIADRLDISVRTVDNLLHRAYRKLDVGGRAELRVTGLEGPPAPARARREEPDGSAVRPAAAPPPR
jgi:DNA-binding CsgD family transcriptional regulator/tetratricopeptide (TPR) repeat protein